MWLNLTTERSVIIKEKMQTFENKVENKVNTPEKGTTFTSLTNRKNYLQNEYQICVSPI